MKTFEEKYTAWVDGQLSDEARQDFEKQLEALPVAAADRAEARRLGELLRSHGDAPQFTNADFFNHQILHRIGLEEPSPAMAGSRRWWHWSTPQLVAAGALCLVVAFVMFKTLMSGAPGGREAHAAPYFAEVVDLWPADPSISATTVYTPQDNITVVWLDGLDYLPASYVLE
jgi:anti-sigma factor RsiW